jgi:hypothetical protein
MAQSTTIPAGYEVLQQVTGDLDKDSIAEKVVVYNTPETNPETDGIIREIIIYKKTNEGWKTWQHSKNAILDSRSGGMLGDPFEEIRLEKGILVISHAGGSSWKWGHEDKYRFQNKRFELIGYSSLYGKPCEYWTDVDYNISTGKIIVKKAYEQCDDDGEPQKVNKTENETFKQKPGVSIHLGNRNQIDIKIVTPRYRHEIYL